MEINSEESKENIEPVVHSSEKSTSDKQRIEEFIGRENMNPVVLLSDIFVSWDEDEELMTLDELPLSKRKVLGAFSKNVEIKRQGIDMPVKSLAHPLKFTSEIEKIVEASESMVFQDVATKQETSTDGCVPKMSSNPKASNTRDLNIQKLLRRKKNPKLDSKTSVVTSKRSKQIASSERNYDQTASEFQQPDSQIPLTPPVMLPLPSTSKTSSRKQRNWTEKTTLTEIIVQDYESVMPEDLDAKATSSEEEWAPGTPFSLQKIPKVHRQFQIKPKPKRKSLKDFQCDDCKQVLCSKQSLMNHIDRKHLKNFLIYYCLYCDFKTTHNSSLCTHMARKHGNQSYECDYCQKTFCSKHDMRVHIGIHTCSPQTCPVCGSISKNEATLKKHIHKMHTQKFFECDVKGCNKSFISEVRFNNHKMKHSDTFECNFSCEECNKKFPTNQMLNYHLETIDHLKRYKCNLCPRSFSRRSWLVSHWTKNHSGAAKESFKKCDNPSVQTLTKSPKTRPNSVEV